MPFGRSPRSPPKRREYEPLSTLWTGTIEHGRDRVTAHEWNGMVVVGQVARTHGRRGEVVVNLDTDFPEQRFRPGGIVYVSVGDAVRALRIEDVRFQSGRPVLALAGVGTIDEAEGMAGCELRVPESEQLPLPTGTYYQHSLVGCEVRTVDDAPIGKVVRVQGAQGTNRLVVQSSNTGDEIEIPFADTICVKVDLAQNVVVVDPPAGLLELNQRGA